MGETVPLRRGGAGGLGRGLKSRPPTTLGRTGIATTGCGRSFGRHV